jgi:ribosomal protein S18 acetylase RimI-like enzyme
MDIRTATPEDRDAVIALWDAAGLTRPWNPPGADFDRALAGTTSTVLLGTDAGELVAVAMVGDDGHRGWVYYVAVPAERRGAGLGAAIMRAAEDWLRARGCPKVQLMVRESNDAVLGFYDALGYGRVEVHVLGKVL